MAQVVKNPITKAGDTRDMGLIPGSRKSPGIGNGNLLQYSHLENSVDRSLAGYNPRVAESDTTEHEHTNKHICNGTVFNS